MALNSLPWRYNDRDSVSNHLPQDCLLNRLFRRRSKKTSKLRVTGLCAGNSSIPRTNGQLRGKKFPFGDVIMFRTFTTGGYFIIRQDTLMQYINTLLAKLSVVLQKKTYRQMQFEFYRCGTQLGHRFDAVICNRVCWLGPRFASRFYKWKTGRNTHLIINSTAPINLKTWFVIQCIRLPILISAFYTALPCNDLLMTNYDHRI